MRRSHGVRRPGAAFPGRAFVAVLATLLAGGGAMVASIPAAAAPPLSCVVNSTGEGIWAGGANCDTSTAGRVTLRSAIEALNAAGAGTHNITFSLPNPSVIMTSSLLLVSTGPLVITGPGARALAVDGKGNHTVFRTDPDIALTMTGMTVRNGFADGDGGGFAVTGPLTLDHVAVTGNTALSGGGIDSKRDGLTISNSLIANNHASRAAGIDLEGNGGTSSFTNVTIANNVNSQAEEGTGIEVASNTLTLNFVTVAGNTFMGTSSPTGLSAAGVGAHDGGHINFHNSVIANNQGANCRFTVLVTDLFDTPGIFTDKGYNLDSADDCGFTEGSPRFDAVKAAANLGTLANNGGQTNTFALGTGSRAIDKADPACSVPTDQRGITRPQGIRCDMGAFEVLAAVASPSPSATPVLPRAGKGSGGPSGGLLLGLVGFGILSALVLARAIRTRSPIRS